MNGWKEERREGWMDETEGEEKKKERKEGRTAAGLELRIE